MDRVNTTGIVLNRINFGEADRIITVITSDQGKISLIAKGVRKEKSKLAGGIELFSISDVTFIPGKRDIGTLISSRLITHYGEIVKEINRTTAAYNSLKLINSVTPGHSEPEYYQVLLQTLRALNDSQLSIVLAESWQYMQLLRLYGHTPNLLTDKKGAKLEPNNNYHFDFDSQTFFVHEQGTYRDSHIKLMRLLLSETPQKVAVIEGVDQILEDMEGLLKSLIMQSTTQ